MRLRHHAFTLVELMVVVAILGLIAAILFPVFAQAKEAAKRMTCISNLRNMALGTVMYVNDHDDGSYQTQALFEGAGPDGRSAAGYVYWYGLVWKGQIYPEYSPVWPYLKSQEIQRCKSAFGYYRASTNVTDVGFAPNSGTFGSLARAANIGGMVIPAETIMYADSAYWSTTTGLSYPVTGTMSCGGTGYGTTHARHLGAGASVGWWDGHATSRPVWTGQGKAAFQIGLAKNRIGTVLKFAKDPSDLTKAVGSDDANLVSGPKGYDCYYYQSTKKIEP